MRYTNDVSTPHETTKTTCNVTCTRVKYESHPKMFFRGMGILLLVVPFDIWKNFFYSIANTLPVLNYTSTHNNTEVLFSRTGKSHCTYLYGLSFTATGEYSQYQITPQYIY